MIAVNTQPTPMCRFEATAYIPHIDHYRIFEAAGSRFDVVDELNSSIWPTSNNNLLPLIGSEITKMAFCEYNWNKNGNKSRGGILEMYLTKHAGALMKASVPYPAAQQAFQEFLDRAVLSRAKHITIRVRHDLNIYVLVPGCAMKVEFDRQIFHANDDTRTGRYKYDPSSV
jgi:hypothetical protein